MKITKTEDQPELSKRFYHGHEFRDDCPKCKEEAVVGADEHLCNPVPGEIAVINFWCEKCETEWTRDTIMTIEFREVKKE